MRPLLLALILLLAACAARPGQEVLLPTQSAASVPNRSTLRMFVVTTRRPAAEQPLFFGNERATTTSHVSYDISIPSTHVPGAIEWPKGTPDPATDFVTLGRSDYDRRGFLNALAAGKEAVNVGLFVHGYNTSMEEAVFVPPRSLSMPTRAALRSCSPGRRSRGPRVT